jgi:hypothetical protein
MDTECIQQKHVTSIDSNEISVKLIEPALGLVSSIDRTAVQENGFKVIHKKASEGANLERKLASVFNTIGAGSVFYYQLHSKEK